MPSACYKCGAKPNHPNKLLDVLRTIRCLDCGTVACVKHRKGIVGGACEVCGSEKSTIEEERKGKSSSFGGGGAGGSSSGSTGADSDSTGGTSISSTQLQEMQKSRKQAEAEGQARLLAESQRIAEETLTEEEKAKRDEIEAKLSELFGDSDLVKGVLAENMISNASGASDNAGGGDNDGSAGGLKAATTVLASAVQQGSIDDQVKEIMDSESFNDGSAGLEFGSDSSVSAVSSQSMVAVEEVGDTCSLSEGAVAASEKVSKVNKITLLDSFNVKSNYRLELEDAIELKEKSEAIIAGFIAEKFNLNPKNIDLTLKVNKFIPLDNIDHLLNLHAEDLAKEHLNIITGVLAQKLTFDTVSYVDQFAYILPQKSYIKGIYVSFANNPEYDFAEQKDLNLQLIDIAQENDRIVYLGLDNCEISHWQEIFDEYDLTEIPFVYTEVIKTQEEIDFVKENNIKILLRPDIDFDFYAKFIKDYPNICFGSAFERISDEKEGEKVANSANLVKILENMHNIDEKMIEKLLNIPEND